MKVLFFLEWPSQDHSITVVPGAFSEKPGCEGLHQSIHATSKKQEHLSTLRDFHESKIYVLSQKFWVIKKYSTLHDLGFDDIHNILFVHSSWDPSFTGLIGFWRLIPAMDEISILRSVYWPHHWVLHSIPGTLVCLRTSWPKVATLQWIWIFTYNKSQT